MNTQKLTLYAEYTKLYAQFVDCLAKGRERLLDLSYAEFHNLDNKLRELESQLTQNR